MSPQSNITLDVLGRLEHDEGLLDSSDLISLIFLLYEYPEKALNTILVYQRTTQRNSLLVDWAQRVQSRPDWQDEFLEALCICKLYGIIRNLGYNVEEVKNKFNCIEQNSRHVDPMKRLLYSLCENMNANNLSKLIDALSSYGIDVREHRCCELILLQLMCHNIITVNQIDKQQVLYDVEALVKIIYRLPDLKQLAENIRHLQNLNCKVSMVTMSKPDSNIAADECSQQENDYDIDLNSLNDVFEKIDFNKLVANLRADSNCQKQDMYPIKDSNRTGVCYIINQEEFYPSATSIDVEGLNEPLTTRDGSSIDKANLIETMQKINFCVISSDNLKHNLMISGVKHVIRHEVSPKDSMFMLCILSHGMKDHVYGADSVEVKVKDIQRIVGQELQHRNILIPKIIVIEACRIDEEPLNIEMNNLEDAQQIDNLEILLQRNDDKISLQSEAPPYIAVDSERSASIEQADFITLWATSPELKAYRYHINDIPQGSIFIRLLCENIRKHAHNMHLIDIFTRVNRDVKKWFGCVEQVASCTISLSEDLYLMYPK